MVSEPSTVAAQVLRAVDARRDELIQLVQKLVRIPSVAGQEGEAQRFVAHTLGQIGLEVECWEPDAEQLRQHPAYEETPSFHKFGYSGRPNVVGILRGQGGGRSLLFYPHIDTFAPGVKDAWRFGGPYSGEVHDGRLYGRGAGDMKSGLACVIMAIAAIQEVGVRLQGDTLLMSVIETEENGVGGTLAALLRGYRADAAILPHPNRGLGKLALARAGFCHFRVRLSGNTGYPYMPGAVDTIEKMYAIYAALKQMGRRRHAEVRHPLLEMHGNGSVHFHVGTIRGGDRVLVNPGWAEIECGLSLIPGERCSDIRRLVETMVDQATTGDPWFCQHVPQIDWLFQTEGVEVPAEAPIVTTMVRAIREVAGSAPQFVGVPAYGDSRFLNEFGIPDVVFGPAAGGGAGADEYVEVADLVPCAQVFARTILDWCGVSSTTTQKNP